MAQSVSSSAYIMFNTIHSSYVSFSNRRRRKRDGDEGRKVQEVHSMMCNWCRDSEVGLGCNTGDDTL